MRVLIIASLCAAAAPAAAQDGDAKRGKMLFLQCAACHTITANAPHKVGPNLHGLIGAQAGQRPGFAASPALAGSGLKWSAETLDTFIASPAKMVPGTKMVFGGMADADRRRDLIAYLTEATR
jgi:cytochrome c